MKALVLAAGRGERLRPLTEATPKPMLEVGGRPLIHYSLMMARAAGITEVAINLHHLAPMIQTALGDGAAFGLKITWAPEPVLLGTGGPLLALSKWLGGDRFAILNGDTILGLSLKEMAAFHRERGALVTLALNRPVNLVDYSRIEIDAQRKVRRMRLRRRGAGGFDDFPAELGAEVAHALDPYMYCGATICDPAVLDELPATAPFGLMSELVAPMVARGKAIFGYVHGGYFGTADDLIGYERLRAELAAAPPRLDYLF